MTATSGWRSVLLLTLLVGLALAPAVAQAQTEAQKQQAKEHYEKARKLYDIGRYAEAVEEYQKVYLLVDDPNMLYNIAQCYRLADRPDEALRFYRNFLRRSPASDRRADVEKKIADLEKTIEDRRRGTATPVTPPATGPATPPPVEVTPTTPPPVTTSPPPMTPTPPTTGPSAAGGTGAPAGVVTDSGAPAEESGSSTMRMLGWTGLITGGVLLATSIVTGAVAASKAKDVETLAKNGGVFDPKLEDSGKAMNAVAIGTGVAGLLIGGTGAVLLYMGRSNENTTARAPRPRLAIVPAIAPGYAGAGAALTF